MEKKQFFKTGIAGVSLLSTMVLTSVLAHHGTVYAEETSATKTDEQTMAEKQQLLSEKTAERNAAQASLQDAEDSLATINQELVAVDEQLAAAVTPTVSTNLATISSGVRGEYLAPEKQAILDKLNAIRKEAYDLGYVSHYVPLKWSTELEKMAMTRAAEATVTGGHTRINGSRYNTMVSENGVANNGENLAWGVSLSISQAIDGWYKEKAGYAAGDRSYNTVGHYLQIIDPTHTHTALGIFATDTPKNYNNIMVAQAFTRNNKGTSESVLGTYGRTDQTTVTNTATVQTLQSKKQELESQKNDLEASVQTKQQAVAVLEQEVAQAQAALEEARLARVTNSAEQATMENETSVEEVESTPSDTLETSEVTQPSVEHTDTETSVPEEVPVETLVQSQQESAAELEVMEELSEVMDSRIAAVSLQVGEKEGADLADISEVEETSSQPQDDNVMETENSPETDRSNDDSTTTTANEGNPVATEPLENNQTEVEMKPTMMEQPLEATQTAVERAEAQGALLPNTGVSPEDYIAFGSAAAAILTGLGFAIPRSKRK